jgi:Gpi18-like mannosyltransferase
LTLYALSKNLFERGKTRAVRRDNGGTHKSAAQGDTSGTYSSSIAFLSAVLHIICPAGVFLSAPYGEAPFSLLNFAGFYLYTSAPFDAGSCGSLRSDLKLLAAGAVFALATMVRSNGALSGILFAYDAIVIVLGVVRDGITFPLVRRLACVLLGGSLIVVGIAAPQYVAYKTYCVSADVPRSWCQNIPPSVYTWVQSHYW